ncbi:MAG: sigma 54-interacting transcriptional regulator [Magnetococcales bacterium]|nr:sigma 54-interacting transcriptional regulator [Magnetococcales bacterium]
MAMARDLAQSDLSVLISGETGTGKELFARLIHDESRCAKGPFVALNCSAIPGELLESEIFGHKKGAFTGAVSDHDGLFVQANGGTLFLDEIGDMPLSLQAKILRVLQEREVQPVGGKKPQQVDVRIVSATHRDLEEMVIQGTFREDLVFRLMGCLLELPPLRDRGRDVVILAKVFLRASREGSQKWFEHDAVALLLSHTWPGNIRELKNAVCAAACCTPHGIGAQHLRRHLRRGRNVPVNVETSVGQRILATIATREQITLAQLHTDLKVPKPTLHRHLEKLQVEGRVCRIGTVWFVTGGDNTALSGAPLSARQAEAIAFIGQEGRITRQQYADVFGVSIRTASRDLSDMLESGHLKQDGQSGRFAGYELQTRCHSGLS